MFYLHTNVRGLSADWVRISEDICATIRTWGGKEWCVIAHATQKSCDEVLELVWTLRLHPLFDFCPGLCFRSLKDERRFGLLIDEIVNAFLDCLRAVKGVWSFLSRFPLAIAFLSATNEFRCGEV